MRRSRTGRPPTPKIHCRKEFVLHGHGFARVERKLGESLKIDRALVVPVGVGGEHSAVADDPHPMIERSADAAGHARDHAAVEIEAGDRKVRRVGRIERPVGLVRNDPLAERGHAFHRAEDRAEPGQVVADMLVGAADLVFVQIGPGRARRAAPGLRMHEMDQVVVEFGVDDAHVADGAVAHRLPNRLDRVAHRVGRRA